MKHEEFYRIVTKQLSEQFEKEKDNIDLAAQYCAESIMKGRVIHVFGCGH